MNFKKSDSPEFTSKGRFRFIPQCGTKNKGGTWACIGFHAHLRHNASYNYLLVNGRRRLEQPRMSPLSRVSGYLQASRQTYRTRAQAGNSVAVPVIKAIASEMIESLAHARTRAREKQMNLFVGGAMSV